MNKIISKLMLLFVSFIFLSSSISYSLLRDDFIEENLRSIELEEPYVNLNYNYESLERIPIKLNIKQPISTKKDVITDGQLIEFIVKDNVFYNGQLFLQRGTVVTGKVQTFITRGMNGIPGTIILDEFNIPNIPKEKLKGTFIKRGMNLTILVLPIKWALTPIPGVGSLTNFIIGGHAKIKKKDTITIYFYPNWGKN